MAIRLGCFLLLVVAFSVTASGEAAPDLEVPQAALQTVNLAEYRSQLNNLRELVSSCMKNAQACDPAKIGDDDRVSEGGFDVHWNWLREVIRRSKDMKLADRDKLLMEASQRLDDEARDVDHTAAEQTAVPFRKARADADRVLAKVEFRHVTSESYMEREIARFWLWVATIFGGVSSIGRHAPWLGPLLEWGFVALAITALLVWARRVMDRQRLAIALDRPAVLGNWQEASRRWADMARDAADQGDWRDAVHFLYWASVVELEGQKVWRQNNVRTPREYLGLLQTESPHYRPLRLLTQLLERIWYGFGSAERGDYDRALALYEELRAA